jgi:outer membrane protein/protease secretion system outer membrane protein
VADQAPVAGPSAGGEGAPASAAAQPGWRRWWGQATQGLGRQLNEAGLGTPASATLNPTLAPADAPIDDRRPLGLLAAWRAAFVNDPALRAARAAAAAGEERLPQAQAQLRPSVQFSASVFRNANDRLTEDFFGQSQTVHDRYNSHNGTLTLRQPLFRQQLQAGLRQAEHLVDDARSRLELETQNLAVRVTGAFLEAMLARDQLALVELTGRALGTQQASARSSFERGFATRTDVDEVQARLDLNRAQVLEARQQVELARRQLEVLVQRPIAGLARLDPDRLNLKEPDPATVQGWVDAALERSPEIRGIQAQREAALEEIAKARAGHLPTVDAIAQWQRSRSEMVTSPRSGYTNASVGLQLNVPLYAGGLVQSQTRQTQAEYERLGEALEATKLDLGVRVHREFRGVTEGRARVAALTVAQRSAEVALDSAAKSFRAGVRTVVDILNAEQQLMQVRRDLAQARYVTLMSHVRLHALAGRADEAFLASVDQAFVD